MPAKMTQDKKAIAEVMQKALVCRVAMSADKEPYVVPMNFGYDGRYLYLHCGGKPTSKKLGILKKNPNICFEVDTDVELVPAPTPCKFSVKYRSVIGRGKVEFVESRDEKAQCLDVLMRHYGWDKAGFPDEMLAKTVVIRVPVEEISLKTAGL